MTEAEFKQRTKRFGLEIMKFTAGQPRIEDTAPRLVRDHCLRQLVRSATSVGANYRAACRAKSERDMLAKLAIVEEEADESVFWLEILTESGLLQESETADFIREADEIVALTVSSIRTLRARTGVRESVAEYGRKTGIADVDDDEQYTI